MGLWLTNLKEGSMVYGHPHACRNNGYLKVFKVGSGSTFLSHAQTNYHHVDLLRVQSTQ